MALTVPKRELLRQDSFQVKVNAFFFVFLNLKSLDIFLNGQKYNVL